MAAITHLFFLLTNPQQADTCKHLCGHKVPRGLLWYRGYVTDVAICECPLEMLSSCANKRKALCVVMAKCYPDLSTATPGVENIW